MHFSTRLFSRLAFAAILALAPAASADTLLDLAKRHLDPERLIDPDGKGFVDSCDQTWVLAELRERFDSKVRAHLGRSLYITAIHAPRLVRSRPKDAEHLVGRQYCEARAVMTDGKTRPIYYVLEYPWAFAGNLTHIEFCIPDLDPSRVHGRACSAVR